MIRTVNPYPFGVRHVSEIVSRRLHRLCRGEILCGTPRLAQSGGRRKLLAHSSIEIRHKATKVKSRLRASNRQCRGIPIAYANRTVSKGRCEKGFTNESTNRYHRRRCDSYFSISPGIGETITPRDTALGSFAPVGVSFDRQRCQISAISHVEQSKN